MFVQVYNETTKPLLATNAITITDTQGNVYRPIPLGPTNLYAYRGGIVRAEEHAPAARTRRPACSAPRAQLLLFKITTVSLDNRPLEMKIVNPLNPPTARPSSTSELDVLPAQRRLRGPPGPRGRRCRRRRRL